MFSINLLNHLYSLVLALVAKFAVGPVNEIPREPGLVPEGDQVRLNFYKKYQIWSLYLVPLVDVVFEFVPRDGLISGVEGRDDGRENPLHETKDSLLL